MFEPIEHPHIISSHSGKDLYGKSVVVVFTDLSTDPQYPDFSENAYESLKIAVQSYINKHVEYDHATIVPK